MENNSSYRIKQCRISCSKWLKIHISIWKWGINVIQKHLSKVFQSTFYYTYKIIVYPFSILLFIVGITGCWTLEPIPVVFWADAGYTLNRSQAHATDTHRATHAHICSLLRGNLESLFNLWNVFLAWKKAEVPRENPNGLRENMQTAHRKNRFWTRAFFQCEVSSNPHTALRSWIKCNKKQFK